MTDAPTDPYLVERIREALAADLRVNELGIAVTLAGARVFITGLVAHPARKRGISEVLRERFPDLEVCNDVSVQELAPPGREEVVK